MEKPQKIWNRKFILLFITNLLVLAAFYASIPTLFQSFVTGTTPAPKRGVANATYMLSYDIGIGIGSLLMGCLREPSVCPQALAGQLLPTSSAALFTSAMSTGIIRL